MKILVDVDLWAGLGAVGYAIVGLFVTELHDLVKPPVAGAFGLAALGRWINRHRPRKDR